MLSISTDQIVNGIDEVRSAMHWTDVNYHRAYEDLRLARDPKPSASVRMAVWEWRRNECLAMIDAYWHHMRHVYTASESKGA